jgi:hypothetical protein
MGFIRERLPRELQEKIRRHGIRNVCVLTVPPCRLRCSDGRE